ncbi:MAG: hypothetical protein ACRCWR_04325, partial [Saezia sp.]
DLEVLKQDVYVGLLAFSAPEGADYMAIGSQVVLNNFKLLEQALSVQQGSTWVADTPQKHYAGQEPVFFEQKIGTQYYEFPCLNLQTHDCAAQITENDITTLISNNKVLMERYLQVIQLPYYNDYLYGVSDPMPEFVGFFSHLRLGQAVLAFKGGRADEGFAILQSEMAFAKRALAHNNGLISKMVAVRGLYTNYHVISSLIDMPEFQSYLADERLQALMQPLTPEEQKGFAHGFENERNRVLYEIYMLGNTLTPQALTLMEERFSEIFGQDMDLSDSLKRSRELANTGAAHNYFASSSIYYLMMSKPIERASLSLADVSVLHMQGSLPAVQAEMLDVLERQNQLWVEENGETSNMLGAVLLREGVVSGDTYINRFYDVQVYMALVNVKYEVARARIKADEMPEFLTALGVLANNPYTQEPFVWDAQNRVLSTTWVEGTAPIAKDTSHMSVFVTFKN